MCGIIGYIGKRPVFPILIEGLERLEYRGYDSAGIALMNAKREINVLKVKGKIKDLKVKVENDGYWWSNNHNFHIGLGHTRWATHGRPCEKNAHPHLDCKGKIALVHNGIIENYKKLKEFLISKGHRFNSDTDTEVLAHLIEEFMDGSLEDAVKNALKKVKGSYAIGVISIDDPNKIVAARNESPLIIGIGNNEYFLASDVPAILNYTRGVIYIEDGELVVLDKKGFKICPLRRKREVKKDIVKISWDVASIEKNGYDHFMLKEIYEQPKAIRDTIKAKVCNGKILLDEINLSPKELRKIKKVFIVACGTSYHAALIGKYMLEKLCLIPVEVDIASEFRYRSPLLDKNSLVIAISQSGETADTLGAIAYAKNKESKIISICNVVGSSITRCSQGTIYTHAGPEIGVASTKAFTTQLAALYLFCLYLGSIKGLIDQKTCKRCLKALEKIPEDADTILKRASELDELANLFYKKSNFLYLGRGINYPIALEGALKLKEISYIHAEGYPAGEMKHGPIALIDSSLPVVILIPKNQLYEKIISNMEEVKSRGGIVIAIAIEGDKNIIKKADHVFYVPKVLNELTPILFTIPLQLLAYYIAVKRGCDVDKPRNLAKSVTVE